VVEAGWRELSGIEVDEASDGRATVRMMAGPRHLNPAGSVHGGAIATLMDSAMGSAVYSTAQTDDATTATIEMKVTYLEPAKEGEIVAKARVIKRGRRVTISEAEATQNGDMVAHAISTFTSPDPR
jgi:uncharacterized protein (TIGR00369 family)